MSYISETVSPPKHISKYLVVLIAINALRSEECLCLKVTFLPQKFCRFLLASLKKKQYQMMVLQAVHYSESPCSSVFKELFICKKTFYKFYAKYNNGFLYAHFKNISRV